MQPANTIDTIVTFAREEILGQLADPATGKRMRRVTIDLNLERDQIKSKEKRPSAMRYDSRGGFRKVTGNLKVEVAPGDQIDIFESSLRSTMVAGKDSGNVVLTAAADGVSRADGSFAALFEPGAVVRFTGFTGNAVANNGKNFLVTDRTALKLFGSFVNGDVTVAGNAAVGTVKEHGGVCEMLTEGHIDSSYTVQIFYPSTGIRKLAWGVCVGDLSLSLSPEGLLEMDVKLLGIDMKTEVAESYFTDDEPIGTGLALAPVSGALYIGGLRNTDMTSMQLAVTNSLTSFPVVGLNSAKHIFRSVREVTGSFTEIPTDIRSVKFFEDEVDTTAYGVFTTSPDKAADYVALAMGRAKFLTTSDDDGDTTPMREVNFEGLEGNNPLLSKSALTIRDSRWTA